MYLFTIIIYNVPSCIEHINTIQHYYNGHHKGCNTKKVTYKHSVKKLIHLLE